MDARKTSNWWPKSELREEDQLIFLNSIFAPNIKHDESLAYGILYTFNFVMEF